MSSVLEQYGYSLLDTIEIPLFGVLRMYYKIDSEEIWLQRMDGSLKLIAPTPAPGGTAFFYQDTVPVTAVAGDRWVNSDTGIEYTYIDDGNSTQWVQFR